MSLAFAIDGPRHLLDIWFELRKQPLNQLQAELPPPIVQGVLDLQGPLWRGSGRGKIGEQTDQQLLKVLARLPSRFCNLASCDCVNESSCVNLNAHEASFSKLTAANQQFGRGGPFS